MPVFIQQATSFFGNTLTILEMISSNSEGTSENRKLGLSVESKKKQFVAKMIKKIHIQALSAHFIFNQLYKMYLTHNLLQTVNYTSKTDIYFHNVFCAIIIYYHLPLISHRL